MQADLRFASDGLEAAFFEHQTERNHKLETQVTHAAHLSLCLAKGGLKTDDARADTLLPDCSLARPCRSVALWERQQQQRPTANAAVLPIGRMPARRA